MTKRDDNMTNYAQMGMAALLPGMQYAVERMQEMLDEFRIQLAAMQSAAVTPTKKTTHKKATGWEKMMTPEERSAEMKRRQEVARANREGKLHPRDPRHPGHDEWKKEVGQTRRAAWNALTPAQQRARLNKMKKAKQAKATTPTVRMMREDKAA